MSAFDDFDEAGFLTIERPGKSNHKAELRLAFMKMRSAERLTLTFKPEVLAEIGGPRFDVAWNPAKRLLLVKAGPQARFEAHETIRGVSRRIVIPLPVGLVFGTGDCEPEFYVDAVGKRLLIEVPPSFGQRLALPAPAAPAPHAPPKTLTPVIPQAEIIAGNREILRSLGITERFPRELRGVKFTPSEALIVEALYRNRQLTRAALLAATHDPEAGDDDRDDKVVDVWLSKMRPRLALLDITVQSLGGGNWGLDAASKGRLKEMLREIEVPA